MKMKKEECRWSHEKRKEKKRDEVIESR